MPDSQSMPLSPVSPCPTKPSSRFCQPSSPLNTLLCSTDQELEAQNWCCRWNDKPSFCILYQQWRPRIGCAGYRPLRPGEAARPALRQDRGRGSREGQPLGAWTRAALASWGRSVATREDGDGSSVLQPMANRRASYMASGKEMGGGEIMSRHG